MNFPDEFLDTNVLGLHPAKLIYVIDPGGVLFGSIGRHR